MRAIDSDMAAIDEALDAAIDDVAPAELGRSVREAVESSDPNPALVCALAAHVADGTLIADDAVGVQLLHTGLALTGRVIDDPEAWADVGRDVADEDMQLLAADVIVTLAFDRLIEHYDAATRVVNAFGREKARATAADGADAVVDHEAAVRAATYGAAAEIGCGDPSPELATLANDLGRLDALTASPAVDAALPEDERTARRRNAADAVADDLDALAVSDGYRDALLAEATWRGQRPQVRGRAD